jgi:glycosyltransferase involved in cell wall biosynthesis
VRIAVNTRLLLPGKLDGIGWFTYHTLSRITRQHPETEFIFLFDRKWSPEFIFAPNVKPHSLFPQARHPFLYYMWFEHAIPAALRKYKADLFLSPDGYLSLSTKVPQLAIIHDLNFEHYPDDLPYLTRNYYRYFFPKFSRKAKRIATVSEFSKRDLETTYHTSAKKIDVVYNGVNELYHPLTPDLIKATRDRYSEGLPYFLFTGMLHPRKNIANLFRAYEQFRIKSGIPVKLVIVGHRKWWTSEMEKVYQGLTFRGDIVFLGRQPIEELINITGAALAMTYVSYFEGFGVPVIEAMRCGVPVITSNVTSLPEVCGDAALMTDPFDVASITAAMLKISSDPVAAKELSEKGLVQAARFSWDATAEKLWQSILKAV